MSTELLTKTNARRVDALVIPHPRATENRVAFAKRFLAGMEASALFNEALDVAFVAKFDAKVWGLFAAHLDESVPSAESVAVIIGLLAAREA